MAARYERYDNGNGNIKAAAACSECHSTQFNVWIYNTGDYSPFCSKCGHPWTPAYGKRTKYANGDETVDEGGNEPDKLVSAATREQTERG
jgi:hypothetical protein